MSSLRLSVSFYNSSSRCAQEPRKEVPFEPFPITDPSLTDPLSHILALLDDQGPIESLFKVSPSVLVACIRAQSHQQADPCIGGSLRLRRMLWVLKNRWRPPAAPEAVDSVDLGFPGLLQALPRPRAYSAPSTPIALARSPDLDLLPPPEALNRSCPLLPLLRPPPPPLPSPGPHQFPKGYSQWLSSAPRIHLGGCSLARGAGPGPGSGPAAKDLESLVALCRLGRVASLDLLTTGYLGRDVAPLGSALRALSLQGLPREEPWGLGCGLARLRGLTKLELSAGRGGTRVPDLEALGALAGSLKDLELWGLENAPSSPLAPAIATLTGLTRLRLCESGDCLTKEEWLLALAPLTGCLKALELPADSLGLTDILRDLSDPATPDGASTPARPRPRLQLQSLHLYGGSVRVGALGLHAAAAAGEEEGGEGEGQEGAGGAAGAAAPPAPHDILPLDLSFLRCMSDSLTTVSIRSDLISDASLYHIASLPKLRKLSLSGANLTDAGVGLTLFSSRRLQNSLRALHCGPIGGPEQDTGQRGVGDCIMSALPKLNALTALALDDGTPSLLLSLTHLSSLAPTLRRLFIWVGPYVGAAAELARCLEPMTGLETLHAFVPHTAAMESPFLVGRLSNLKTSGKLRSLRRLELEIAEPVKRMAVPGGAGGAGGGGQAAQEGEGEGEGDEVEVGWEDFDTGPDTPNSSQTTGDLLLGLLAMGQAAVMAGAVAATAEAESQASQAQAEAGPLPPPPHIEAQDPDPADDEPGQGDAGSLTGLPTEASMELLYEVDSLDGEELGDGSAALGQTSDIGPWAQPPGHMLEDGDLGGGAAGPLTPAPSGSGAGFGSGHGAAPEPAGPSASLGPASVLTAAEVPPGFQDGGPSTTALAGPTTPPESDSALPISTSSQAPNPSPAPTLTSAAEAPEAPPGHGAAAAPGPAAEPAAPAPAAPAPTAAAPLVLGPGLGPLAGLMVPVQLPAGVPIVNASLPFIAMGLLAVQGDDEPDGGPLQGGAAAGPTGPGQVAGGGAAQAAQDVGQPPAGAGAGEEGGGESVMVAYLCTGHKFILEQD